MVYTPFKGVDVPGPKRQFAGYGRSVPKVRWPQDARVAVSIALNYEEGSEYCHPNGDGRNDGLTEMIYAIEPHHRDLCAESVFEYGTRAGVWRVERLLTELKIPITVYACAVALERNREVAAWLKEAGHEPCSHGWRWEEVWQLTREEEADHIRRAIELIEETCGTRPAGWYCRYGPSVNTRELLVEEGGFVYDSDAYNDDLPYYTDVKGKRHLVIPYSMTYNDAKFGSLPGYGSPSDFVDNLTRGFDQLVGGRRDASAHDVDRPPPQADRPGEPHPRAPRVPRTRHEEGERLVRPADRHRQLVERAPRGVRRPMSARRTADKLDAQLARIDALNPAFRAFTTVDAVNARARARDVDAAADDGEWLGILHGMTIAVKDNIDTAGIRTACGSRLFADHVPNADAPVVERLRRSGAIVVGKSTLMELAFGVRTLDQVGGQCRNPWNPEHVPGGSSGGSAAAVALDMCDGALGTDTGGSVRVPAGFCGVTGLRPTHGLVSNRGVLPVSASMDTVGPMARRIEDVARLLVATAGYDREDPTSVDRRVDASLLDTGADVSDLRIAVPRNFYFDDIDPDVEEAVRRFADTLASAGATIVDVDVAGAEEAHQHATTMIFADACALHADALDSGDLISTQVRERMLKGRIRTGVDYARAVRFRESWRKMLRDLFAEADALLMPTSPYPAPLIDDGIHLEEATRHATRFTFGGGLSGTPGLSLPGGISRTGLPIGILVEAAWWNEATLIRIGKAWQSRTDWHLRRPPADSH